MISGAVSGPTRLSTLLRLTALHHLGLSALILKELLFLPPFSRSAALNI